MEENALPTLIFMLQSDDAGIHYEAVCELVTWLVWVVVVCCCSADVVSNRFFIYVVSSVVLCVWLWQLCLVFIVLFSVTAQLCLLRLFICFWQHVSSALASWGDWQFGAFFSKYQERSSCSRSTPTSHWPS